MNLTISGHHLEVTPALREYVTAKLEKIRRHFDQVIDVNVFLSVDKLQQKAEIALHVRGDRRRPVRRDRRAGRQARPAGAEVQGQAFRTSPRRAQASGRILICPGQFGRGVGQRRFRNAVGNAQFGFPQRKIEHIPQRATVAILRSDAGSGPGHAGFLHRNNQPLAAPDR
jgi:hypothetical protein